MFRKVVASGAAIVAAAVVTFGLGVRSADATTFAESVLYSFCSQGGTNCTDGALPAASVIQAHDGNIYGTTLAGGTAPSGGGGVVFQITPSGTETNLYSFCQAAGSCIDGVVPRDLIEGPDGNFYGITEEGGANSANPDGTVFRITSAGNLTTIYSFCSIAGCTDGSGPLGGLTLGSDGNLYGTTYNGGNNSGGTIYKMTLAGVESPLYSFCSTGGANCTDGKNPAATLIQGSDGNFYGTTEAGGANGKGTVFKISSTGTFATLYSFCSKGGTACTDGETPQGVAGLVEGTDGNFYGTTEGGGSSTTTSAGTFF